MTQNNISESMQAVQQDAPGAPLVVRTVPVPRPKAGQVLIRMAASPINPSDLGALGGFSYNSERSYPFTPGLEGSGTVVAAGEGMLPRFLAGRRVACSASVAGVGTWAEYMVTSAKVCMPLAGQVNLEQAAMMLVNPLTAMAFFEIAQRDGHRAMVNTTAASVLGGMMIRLGARYNLPIIHIVRRQAQVDLVRARGGEHVLNSSEPDFVEWLSGLASQLGATLFLDAVAGEMTQQLADAAPYGSTILLYSRMSHQSSVLDSRTALVKNLHLQGWFLPNWLREKNIFQVLLLSRRVQGLLGTDLHSHIHQRVPLSAAQSAVEAYVGDMTAGKTLFVMG